MCMLYGSCVVLFECNCDFFSSRHFVDGMHTVALVPAMMTMSGATFHPFVMRLFMSGWRFVVFVVMDYS